MSQLELSVVMPSYNELDSIEPVIKDWTAFLTENIPSFEIVVINDGSTDGTGRALDKLRKDIRQLRVIHQLNTGHGRAIRRGYELARGKYILQINSDGRYETGDFLHLWNERKNADLILAHRTHRLDNILHRTFSNAIRRTAQTLFSITLQDPNVPFRLFHRDAVMATLSKLPAHWDSVNLAMSVLMMKEAKQKVLEVKVPDRLPPNKKPRLRLSALISHAFHHLNELFRLRVILPVLQLTT